MGSFFFFVADTVLVNSTYLLVGGSTSSRADMFVFFLASSFLPELAGSF